MSDLRVPDLNHIFIAGRLTRDPELRYLQSGMALCKLSVANTRYFKGKDGERREDTCFVDVTVWDRQAEWIGERFRKGRPVLIEGRLKMDSWEDRTTGQRRSRLEIHAQRVTPLDWDDNQGGAPGRSQGGGGYSQQRNNASYGDAPAQPQGGGYQQAPPAQAPQGGGYQAAPAQQAPAAPQPRPIEEPIPAEDDIPF